MRPFFILCSLIFCCLEARIAELAHFQDLPSYIEEEALLILDIDDTLLIPVQMLGSDAWFQYRWQLYRQTDGDEKKALDKSLAVWEAVRHLTKMEIVEPGTESVVQNLQMRGIAIMGLTTQGLALATRTSQQLLEERIDLSLTAPSSEDHYVQVGGHGVLYRNGILFTSGTDKGEAFFRLCEAMQYHPKKILFVNDKKSHLMELETAAQKRSVEFLGLRYSYSDARKAAFIAEVAEYQFAHSPLARLLSDQEALEAMHSF
jgi:hypothetical protein